MTPAYSLIVSFCSGMIYGCGLSIICVIFYSLFCQ
uniref:Uncharacterized protein n=1 Tax=Arundo donax TaxID=35708 RepID=A0A0A9CMM7_ARUDO